MTKEGGKNFFEVMFVIFLNENTETGSTFNHFFGGQVFITLNSN